MLFGKNEKPMTVGDFIFMRSGEGPDEREICQVCDVSTFSNEYTENNYLTTANLIYAVIEDQNLYEL